MKNILTSLVLSLLPMLVSYGQEKQRTLDGSVTRKVDKTFDSEKKRFEEKLQANPEEFMVKASKKGLLSRNEIDSLYLENKRSLYKELYKVYDQQLPLSYFMAPEFQFGGNSKKAFPYVFSGRPVVVFNILRPTVAPTKLKPDLGLFFSPEIRMFTTESKPVRTPSFHVGLYARVYLGNSVSLAHFPFLEFSVVHHSNGQDAQEFEDENKKVVNLYNGNFSTNYAEISIGKRTTLRRNAFMFHKVGINVQNSIPGGFSDQLWKNYGIIRPKYSFWYAYRNELDAKVKFPESTINSKFQFERIRIGGDITLIAGEMEYAGNDYSRRINAEFYVRYGFYASKVFPTLMFGYYGQDPYNVYYENSYFYVRLGLTSNLNSINIIGDK